MYFFVIHLKKCRWSYITLTIIKQNIKVIIIILYLTTFSLLSKINLKTNSILILKNCTNFIVFTIYWFYNPIDTKYVQTIAELFGFIVSTNFGPAK